MATDSKGLGYALLRWELLTQENPDLPLEPQPMRPKTSSSMVMAGHKPRARHKGEKSWREKLGNPMNMPKTSEQPASQRLMQTTAHVAIDWPLTKGLHAPRLVPLLGLIFPFPGVARRRRVLFIVFLRRASVAGSPIITQT